MKRRVLRATIVAAVLAVSAAPAAHAYQVDVAVAAPAGQKKVLKVPLAPEATKDSFMTLLLRSFNDRLRTWQRGAQQLAQGFTPGAAPQVVAQRIDGQKKKVAAVNKAGLAAVAARAVAVNANNDAMLMQFQTQFQPILTSELAFIRCTCDVPKERRAAIKKAGEEAVKFVAQDHAKRQQQPRPVNAETLEPAKAIREKVVQALGEAVTPEQFERYKVEAARRMEMRKRAAILGVVARLDSVLFLTAEQRDQLTESFNKNWQDSWENWLMMGVYAQQYVPNIPDQFIVQSLSEPQKTVWKTLQKIQFGYFNFNMGGEVLPVDDWWGDEGEEPAKPAGINGAVQFIFQAR